MEEVETDEVSSRRGFLVRSAVATGAFAAASVPGSSALAKKRKRKRKKKKKYYALSASAPFHQCAPGRPGPCTACPACQAHAANKLFPTSEAANAHRAHPGCRCGVVEVGKIKKKKYKKLFGPLSNRLQVVDRRNANVARILAQ